MRSYGLNIAGYRIRFESADNGFDLVPSERFHRFLSSDSDHDVFIKIHPCKYNIPRNAEKVFSAPYIEEVNGIKIRKNKKFWSVYKIQNDLFIKTSFPLSPEKKNAVLKFSPATAEWDMWIEGAGKNRSDGISGRRINSILYLRNSWRHNDPCIRYQ